MQQRSVPDRELQACLAGGQHLAVVLVDKHILELGLPLWSESQPPLQGYTGEMCLLRYQPCTGAWPCKEIFDSVCLAAGHYVVLCGFSRESEMYIVRDPDPRTASLGFCSVKASVLDAARKAFGTDEDLLIVKLV